MDKQSYFVHLLYTYNLIFDLIIVSTRELTKNKQTARATKAAQQASKANHGDDGFCQDHLCDVCPLAAIAELGVPHNYPEHGPNHAINEKGTRCVR